MTKEEIKKEADKCSKQIQSSQKRLDEIRKLCKHEKTYEGNYSWRIGSYQLADICEYCGEMVRYK